MSLTIKKIGRCPYCGREVQMEPASQCCGEAHGEWVYEDENGIEYSKTKYDLQKKDRRLRKLLIKELS